MPNHYEAERFRKSFAVSVVLSYEAGAHGCGILLKFMHILGILYAWRIKLFLRSHKLRARPSQ